MPAELVFGFAGDKVVEDYVGVGGAGD